MKKINTEIKHPDYWNEMERQQKAKIEQLGLVADFAHKQFMKPAQIKNKEGDMITVQVPASKLLALFKEDKAKTPRHCKGYTTAFLYKPNLFGRLKVFRKENPGVDTKKFVPEATGQSFCSFLDNYDRKVGRILATERAINAYEKQ